MKVSRASARQSSPFSQPYICIHAREISIWYNHWRGSSNPEPISRAGRTHRHEIIIPSGETKGFTSGRNLKKRLPYSSPHTPGLMIFQAPVTLRARVFNPPVRNLATPAARRVYIYRGGAHRREGGDKTRASSPTTTGHNGPARHPRAAARGSSLRRERVV